MGVDAADRRALADLRTVQQAAGLSVEPLTVREARRREPLLSPGISCAFDIPADHQVDPRRLLARIRELLRTDRRCTIIARRAGGLVWEQGRVAGASFIGGGSIRARDTIVANGLGAATLEGLPAGLEFPLRPVHGDILRLRVPARLRPLLTATVRGLVRGVPVYIVPRQDGTVVIGATQREDALGDDNPDAATQGGVPGRRCPPAVFTSCCVMPSSWSPPSPNWNCWRPLPGPGRGPRTTRRCWAGWRRGGVRGRSPV